MALTLGAVHDFSEEGDNGRFRPLSRIVNPSERWRLSQPVSI